MPLTKEKRLNLNYYKLLPEGAPYQLIEGELIMTPAPNPMHQIISSMLFKRLSHFVDTTKTGIVLYSPIDLYLDDENAFQPDLILILNEKKGIIKEDGIYGPPDLVIEVISPSTASYDIREKFRVYERSGVKEYWIVDPQMSSVEIYFNEDGHFSLITKVEGGGRFESLLLKGFEIDLEELFKSPL